MYCIVLYCIVLYCIVLYCIVLYCIVNYLERVRINMKRKVDWEEEEQSEREDYSDEESDEEEPRIKDVLGNLSQAVSIKRVFCFGHPVGN